MQISIDTSTATVDELTALIALLASLGGRTAWKAVENQLNIEGRSETVAAPPPPPADERPASEQLLEQAASSRAAPPPPPSDDDGPAVDPTTLDKDGIPWDARIHASTKTQNKDGTWKKLRNVNEVLYGQVHAELQAQYAGNAGASAGTDQSSPNGHGSQVDTGPTSDSGQNATNTASPSEGNAPAAPPPPPETESANTAASGAAPTAAASATGGSRFPAFAQFVQAVNALRQPPIPYLELNALAGNLGVAAFKDMKDHADLWETFYGMAGGE